MIQLEKPTKEEAIKVLNMYMVQKIATNESNNPFPIYDEVILRDISEDGQYICEYTFKHIFKIAYDF